MICYKNTSITAKTFYGVTFNPGESRLVPGHINAKYMIRVPDSNVVDSKKKSTEKRAPELPKSSEQSIDESSKTDKVEKPRDVSKVEKFEKQGGESDGADKNK